MRNLVIPAALAIFVATLASQQGKAAQAPPSLATAPGLDPPTAAWSMPAP